MSKINIKLVINYFKIIFLILIFPCLIIISFSYSSNFNLLNHQYTLINGNNFYFDDEILSNIYTDYSILDIRPNEIQNVLNNMTFIESSKVSKIYPYSLLIEIIENKPLLYLTNNENIILIDEKEKLLPVNAKVKSYFKVPIVYINDGLNIDFSNIDLTYFNEIINILKFSKTNFISLYNYLNKIDILDDHYELIYMDKTKIYLSKNNANIELKYLSKFKNTINNHRILNNYLYIDMRVENQIIVKEKKII